MESKSEYLRIALQMMDVNVNEAFCDVLIEALALVEKKKGKGTLKDACKLKVVLEKKHKGLGMVYPDANHIRRIEGEVKQRREQILDIHQMSSLLLKHPDLRPRVWRGIAGDINNRCTD